MEAPPPLLAARHIGCEIPGRWLWRDLSFEVKTGQRMTVVGPSGAGKSVLLRCLAGLTGLTEGELFFKGQPLLDVAMPRYRSTVLYVPQTPPMIEGTVRDNVKSVLTLGSNKGIGFDDVWARGLLEEVGRDAAFLDKSADTLSGGERQIVALLRALQLKPEILLLDEPVASLDNVASEQLITLIQRTLQQSEIGAVIWAAHQVGDPGIGYGTVLELGTAKKMEGS